MEIIKNRKIVRNTYTHLADDDALPSTGDVTVSLTRWRRDRAELDDRTDPVGVRLAPSEEPEALLDDLEDLPLIVIEFPKFTDGRGYTTARLLRDRYRYPAELRATGHVLRDQLFYLQRCGVNAFELSPGKSLEDALESLTDFSVTYQAGADEPRPMYRRGIR